MIAYGSIDRPWPSRYVSAMFIRRTTIESRESGEPYFTYRQVPRR
jgi:hypothetical protein